MYQHIQLRRLSNLCSNATSQKVDGLDALKQKVASDIYDEDDVLVLKELSNKMDELEEVILVEDEPALRLPQLSNDSWNSFVEELSQKYECDEHLSPSVPQSTNAKRKFQIADYTQSSAHRVNVSDDVSGVVSISSDEDEQSSTFIPAEHLLSSSKDFLSPIEAEVPTNDSCTSSANVESNEGIASLEDRNKLDSGQLNENCTTAVKQSVNNAAPQHSTEPISNIKSVLADNQHQILHNVMTASNNSAPCADNTTLLEPLRGKASHLSKHKALIGINKKYQDIKRRTYKLTFHQILQIFDIEKSAQSTIGAIPGQPIELDFPDHDMREFVKIVKSYQATESIEDVRHLWTQIKSWLCAMKPAYGTTTNYTKYHKKLNWYITELMAQYIKFEIENSIQNENYYKLKMEALMNTVSSLLNDDVNLKILTLLRTNFPDKPSNFLDDLFKKYLTHPKVRLENNNYGIYRLKVLAFQKWMHYTNRKKHDIVEIAIKERSAYLPRMVPKNTEDPFCRVDESVDIIDDYDKQGTRKLLEENVSIDVLKSTINKYLQVYESQLYDDFGYRLLGRQGLEHSQPRTPSADAMQLHRPSPKAMTARGDARHCTARRTHQTHTHHNNTSSSRATHLPAGRDIQRNRLSSSPLRTNKCSCKPLVAKHQSDTSLSCKTPSGNEIISLDSTDDEDDKQASDKLSTEKSSVNTEKRNQSTEPRLVRRMRHALQTQIADNRQTNTTTQRTRPGPAHAPRHRKQPPKKVDTIVLDSSSSEDEDEDTSTASVDACDEVNKHKIDKIDDAQTEEPTTQPQLTAQQQQAARARLQSVAMPLRCALIGSVAIKPIRKEKHCIPGEVSSTTSHDISETESLNAAPAGSCSANSAVNNASAYENAREVGTVEILERRELHQPVVMAERCFQPGKLLLGIDYSDDENEDDVAERNRENIAAGSDAGDDDGVSNGCFISMVGGYSKVVEEATSSTEVFQRIQSLENIAAAEALRVVEPAPAVLAGLAERTANVAVVRSEDTPTCSKYANRDATNTSETKGDAQEEVAGAAAHAAEYKSGQSLKISVKDFASANNIIREKDAAEGRLAEDVESDAPAFGVIAGLGNVEEQQQVSDKIEDESSIKTVPISTEAPKAVNKEPQDTHFELMDGVVKNNAAPLPTEDDETAAIDQILADIDENLRESHEFNEKYMNSKNVAGAKSLNLDDKTENCEDAQNDPDLTNTAASNVESNAMTGNSEEIEEADITKSALMHTNEDLGLRCEPVVELAKISVDLEAEAHVTVMTTKSTECTENIASNELSNELLSENSVETVTLVEKPTLQTTTNIHTEGSEEVISNKSLVNVNDKVEPSQESDILDDICPREVKTSVILVDTQTETNPKDESKPKECEPQNEDTETVGLEKYAFTIEDKQEKSAGTDSGVEYPDPDLNKSGLAEMNAEDTVEKTEIPTEIMTEERMKDTEVLEKPVEIVEHGTELTLSEKNISSQIDVPGDTELEASSERAQNVDNDLNNETDIIDISNDMNLITNRSAEAGKCEPDTEKVFESRTVADDTEDFENDYTDKTSEESEISAAERHTENENIERYITSDDTVICVEVKTFDNSAMSPKAIPDDSDPCNEFKLVDDIENLHTDVLQSDNEPCATTELMKGNEMIAIDDRESFDMSELAATDIGEVTVITIARDCIETENETTPIVEDFSSVVNEMETIEPEASVIETRKLDLNVQDTERQDSVSRNSEEEVENKVELTKQCQELVKKSNSIIGEASETEIILTVTKDDGSTPREDNVVVICSSIKEVNSLLETSTKTPVNEREANELEITVIEIPKIDVKAKGVECHEIADSVMSNTEESGDKIELANEYFDSSAEEKTETAVAEPLAAEANINNSHEANVLTTNKIEEVIVDTNEKTKEATETEAVQTTLKESNACESEDIEYKNLPQSVCMTMEEGFETADVGTLPISHEIVVSASNDIEEEVEEEEINEDLTKTEDENKTTCVANEEFVNKSDVVTAETPETTDIELTLETTADTGAVTDNSIEELDNSSHDILEDNKQLIETSDSKTGEDTTYEDSNGHNTNISIDKEMSSHEETTNETSPEVWAKSSTNDETNKSSTVGTEVVESLVGEKVTQSAVLKVAETKDCSEEMAKKPSIENQTEEVSDVGNLNTQTITDSTIDPQEQEKLDEINTNETTADSAEVYETESKVVALSNSITELASDQCALGNVLTTKRFDEDSDQNANISEEDMKEIVTSAELEVKEISEEDEYPNDELTESCEFLTGEENVEDTSTIQGLQADDEQNDNMTRTQDVVSSANNKELVAEVIEEAATTDSIAQVVELAKNKYIPLKEDSQEPCLTIQTEPDTSAIPDDKSCNAEEEKVEIKLTAKTTIENDGNNSSAKDFENCEVEALGKSTAYSETTTVVESELKEDGGSTVITEVVEESASTEVELVADCERETTDTNSLNNNNQSSVEIDTLLEGAAARRSESETVKAFSRHKLKLKSKPHKLIKTATVEKGTTSSGKKLAKLKAVRNSKKRLLPEDASGKIRMKRRVSPSNYPNKDLGNVEELQTAEELADNIAKLVIKENLEVAEDTVPHEKHGSIKQVIENTEIIENQKSAEETEQQMLAAEAELDEDCTTFQRLPSEYNSEEILAVATLINMRNKYASSTYLDEDNVVVELPPEINRDEEAENVESTVKPGLKKTNPKESVTKEGVLKKKVRFDENNLLELMNEKIKALKKVKKLAKKLEKSRKAEGALLSGAGGGKKYVKRRLIELTTNLSTNEVDYMTNASEQAPDLKKKRGRKGSATAQEEQPLPHKMDELCEELKSEPAGNDNPIYPVRLTSRRKSETTADAKLSKSIKNSMPCMKYEAPTISDVEDEETDFIVPDDEVEPLCTEMYEKPSPTKETILNVSRVCVDGTKIKFKITPKKTIDRENPVKDEKRQESEMPVNKVENRAVEEKTLAQFTSMKTRKVTVKLKRIKIPLYATAISEGSIFNNVVQSAKLTDSEDLILPESPNKFKKCEELESSIKSKKREEPNPSLLKSPTKSKKRDDVDLIVSESSTKPKKRKEPDPTVPESPTKSKKHEELDSIVRESSIKSKKHVEPNPILSESPIKSKKRDDVDLIVSESTTKLKKRKEPDPTVAESPTKSKKEELDSIVREYPNKPKKREKPDPIVRESSTKDKKLALESDIASNESKTIVLDSPKSKNNEKLLIAKDDVSSKNLEKTSHRKHRAKSPNKTKKSVKRDFLSALSELPTVQDTNIVDTQLNEEQTNVKNVSIEELSLNKQLLLESASLENTNVAENNVPTENRDSSTKITVKPVQKKRLAKTSISELSPMKEVPLEGSTGVVKNVDVTKNQALNANITEKSVKKKKHASPTKEVSAENTPLDNTEVVENVDPTKNEDHSAKLTFKATHKKRHLKSSSNTKSPALSITSKDIATSNEELNKAPSTLQEANIEKTTRNNEISAIEHMDHELSPRKALAETTLDKEPIVLAKQLENMDVQKTKSPNANITTKAARKNRTTKSSFKIKLPISSSAIKNVCCIESTLNMEPLTIKDPAISETSSFEKVTAKAEEPNETGTYSEETPIATDSRRKRDSALQEISPKEKRSNALQKSTLEKVDMVTMLEENKVCLSAEVAPITPEKATIFQEHILSDAEIKTEPLEDIQIKEEEDSCEPIDIAQSYLNIDNRRHTKEFVLKPCDVILTEAKINEQAEAHRGLRKQRNRKSAQAVEKTGQTSANSNRYKRGRNKALTTDISKSTENIIEDVIPTLKESAQIEETVDISKEQEKPKVQKELQTETTEYEREENKAVKTAETTVTVEKEVQQNATSSTAEIETEDQSSSITDTVIAELKLLSPESIQNTEDDKDQLNLITCTVVEIEKEQEHQSSTDNESVCKVEKADEEQKTAQLLDSSIDIVLGNATFTKEPLTSKKQNVSLSAEAVVSNLSQNMVNAVTEAKKPVGISENTPTKNRLDVLTADKINSVLEKMLEEKNNLLMESQNQTTTASNVRPTIKRQTNTEEEGMRKSSNRSSLNSVKQISAKVPDALFADDESESSNADDSTSDEQFFAPILSLDDLLKKDEPTVDTYIPTQVVQETDATHSADGLGTPNFTVELEVETTQASDENSQSADGNRKVESQSEDSGKCVAGEELNTNLEETDANFSLSAIADISTIDIPSDLNINNEYPDLLDAMLFEQVRQSIDCMISGTNSAKKWSQDSFATTKPQVNFNKTETAVRTDVAPSPPITQENGVIPTIDKTVATSAEDAIGIGQETFLGTISSLDEVEVPTTGFDLVGSFTIADFLSDAGSDLFAFPELDKTESRSNSFSAESNLCETPPPPAIDTADEETSNDKKDEISIQTLTNHTTNSVACDHSYNKDINEVEKSRTKVRKKSTSSNSSTPTAPPSSTKSAVSTPSNNSDMLHAFSRAKCLPKPFWKVKKPEEIKTSTPKKEEPTHNTQNIQLQTPAATARSAITLSPITVTNTVEKQTVFNMPALELVIEQTALVEEITATPSNNAKSEAISTTQSETLTSLNENITEAVGDVTQTTSTVTETAVADFLDSSDCETRPPKRTSTPIEITEVITIPAPLIVQPIIRIQSQTNRLERIDPSSSASQQAFPLITTESQPNFTDTTNGSQTEMHHISRPERDSTPTLDEPTKDEYEFSTTTNSLMVDELTRPAKACQSPMQREEPPAKRLCVENVHKTITTNDIFDMLKIEEKLQKENRQKTREMASIKIVDSKQTDIELTETKLADNTNLQTSTEVAVNDACTNLIIEPAKVENKSPRPYTQSAQIKGEKEVLESSKTSPQIDKKPADISGTKQNSEKLSSSQEPILISKETLIALKKREHASKNMSTMTITEHMEHLQPLSPESTPEKCYKKVTDNVSLAEKVKTSPDRRVEGSKEEKSVIVTTKDLHTQPTQSSDSRSKPVQFTKNTPSSAMPTTKLDPIQSSTTPAPSSADEHSCSARTSIAQSKKQKVSNASPVFSNASPCAKSITNACPNKMHENTKTSNQLGITDKEDVRNTPLVKSNIHIKVRDLSITEVINKSETKNGSPGQAAAISPRTTVPPKPVLAVAPTLLPHNANRYHPYQKTQTPPNTLNSHKSKTTPQRQSRDSLTATPENVSNKKKETLKPADKTTPQRITSTVTTLPPLMQSRPTPSHQSSFGTPPTIADLASIKLTPEEEAEIARKLDAYRSTLPSAKTYGAHKENQRLVNLQEEKLRLEYAERASRRKTQQMRDTQRLKRKSQPDTYEAHYKKFAMHSAKSDNPHNNNSSSSSSSSSRSSSSASVGAGHHQSRAKPYPQQHAPRSRPHHEYVNKFGEIEKLVEKEKVTKDTETKRSVPLTASTAWEPKMPTGDELIELLCKTKKS